MISKDTQPYIAFEKLIHESRHAYTCHALKNPSYHKNKEQIKEWQQGWKDYPSSREAINRNIIAYKRNPLEQFSENQGKLFTRMLQREHELQRSQKQLSKELTKTRALASPNRHNQEKYSQTQEKSPPLRTFRFGKSFTAEVRKNHLRHGMCKLTIREGKARRNFNVAIPKGYKAQDLVLDSKEAKQLSQRGRTESGKIRFRQRVQNPTPQKTRQQSQSQQRSTQSQQKSRSRERER